MQLVILGNQENLSKPKTTLSVTAQHTHTHTYTYQQILLGQGKSRLTFEVIIIFGHRQHVVLNSWRFHNKFTEMLNVLIGQWKIRFY